MRKETKIGIIIGIIIAVAGVFYFANQEKGEPMNILDNVSFDDSVTTASQDKPMAPETTEAKTQPDTTIAETSPETTGPTTAPDTSLATTETDDTVAIATASQSDTDIEPAPEMSINPASQATVKDTTQTKPAPVAIKDDPFANLPTVYQKQMNEARYHTVKKGDSLYSISSKYFGNGKYWEAIYKANKGTITNASSLRIGWKLRIPTPDEIEN